MAKGKAKDDYRPGAAGWYLLQSGWTEVPQRKPPNGARPFPLWSWDGGTPVELSEAIAAEWERIKREFEEKQRCG
jgi:hypothetical protein